MKDNQTKESCETERSASGAAACSLGERVRDLRKALGLTQEGLSKSCGLSRTQITNIETDRSGLTIDTLFEISAALETTPNDLLNFPVFLPTPDPVQGSGLSSSGLFGWLPISSAPRDGTLIDLCCESVEGEETHKIRLTDVSWHKSDHFLLQTGWARITDDFEIDLVDSPPTCPLGLPKWTPKYWRPIPSLPNVLVQLGRTPPHTSQLINFRVSSEQSSS